MHGMHEITEMHEVHDMNEYMHGPSVFSYPGSA